jgi:hypothetical protein
MDALTTAMGLATYAPRIVKWLSGSDKAEAVAQKVVAVAEAVTGRPGTDAVYTLEGNPDKVLEFRTRIAELEADVEKAVMEDKQHARAAHRDHWMPWLLTLTLVAMVSGTVAGLLFVAVPDGNKEVLYLIVGQLIGAFVTAVAYWLGSSRGSAVKQDELTSLMAAAGKSNRP